MKFNHLFIALIAIFGCFAQANAQLDRSFVSTTGADSATCGAFGTPCRDFGAALLRTNNGGVVTALNSGLMPLRKLQSTNS